MIRTLRQKCLGALLLAAVAWPLPAHGDEALWQKIKLPDHFAILRHALAPGFDDPPEFRIGDCATQRNLDDTGRAQARRIGARFREAGIAAARVYSSEWCRCIDTAQLLGLGEVQTLSALNSLFGRSEDEIPNMHRLRAFLASVDRRGAPVVLVSHQATIRALTGSGTTSGEIIVFRFGNDDEVEVVGRIPPDDTDANAGRNLAGAAYSTMR